MSSKKMTVAASLQLFDIVNRLLFTGENIERNIPTLTKLALVKTRDILMEDVYKFRQEVEAVRGDMGIDASETPTEEQVTSINEKIKPFLSEVIEREITQVNMEDIEYINDIQFNTEELSLIAAALIHDKVKE